jgi:hypothetical protein
MTECNWGIYIRMDTSLADKARAVNNLLQNCHIYGSGRTHPTFTDAQGISANRQDSLKVDNCWVDGFADNGFDCGSSTECRLQTIDAITARTPYSSGISTAIAM